VPHLLGIDSGSGNFFGKLRFVLQHLPDASPAPMLTGLLSLIAMQLLRHVQAIVLDTSLKVAGVQCGEKH
jgi:hypothetical protein